MARFGFFAFGGGQLSVGVTAGPGDTDLMIPGVGRLYLVFVDADKAYMYKADARLLRGGTFVQRLHMTRHLIELPQGFPVSSLSRDDCQTWFKIEGQDDFVQLTLQVRQYAEQTTSRSRVSRAVRIFSSPSGGCYFESVSGCVKVETESEGWSIWNLIMGGVPELERRLNSLSRNRRLE